MPSEDDDVVGDGDGCDDDDDGYFVIVIYRISTKPPTIAATPFLPALSSHS